MITAEKKVSYLHVTESALFKASQEQIDRLYTRYKFAAQYCQNKDVLEVACGAGLGLGLLANVARRVVGGDIDQDNLALAQKTYRNRIETLHLKAESLSFPDNSFDVVILFEAIYYLSDPEKFLGEAHRVLRNGGQLLIGSANKEWAGFNPSPFSIKYFSARELHQMLEENGFHASAFADCPLEKTSFKSKIIGSIKEMAVKYDLMPKTMKGKELFKRIFMGKLIPLPSELTEGMATFNPPVAINPENVIDSYKVLFSVGTVKK